MSVAGRRFASAGERALTGRDALLRSLDDSIRSTLSGHARVVVLRGEPGSGKTALVDAAAAARPEGVLLLSAAGHELERELPYAGVHQLLAPMHALIPELPSPHRGRLARALAYEDGDPTDAMALAGSLLWLLTREAESRPLLLVVDDAHWLDRSSQQALVFVARRLDADALCMLLCVRRDEHEPFSGLGESVEVESLDDEAARELLRSEHAGLAADVAERLVRHAGGLPLALIEMPAELSEAQRRGSEPLPPRMSLGTTLDRLYRRRLADLGTRTRAALVLASLAELDHHQLHSALAAADLAICDLDAAESAGLIDLVAGRCRFRHPAVRVAAQRTAGAAQLRAAHAILAGLRHDDPIAAALHVHHSTAQPSAHAETALIGAARWASEHGGWAESANLWAAALTHTADPGTIRDYRANAVRAHLQAGSGPAALALLEQLIAEARDDLERAEWHQLEIVAWMWTELARPPGTDALASLGERLLGGGERSRAAGLRLLTTVMAMLLTRGGVREAKAIADLVRAPRVETGLSLPQQLLADCVDVQSGTPGAGSVLRSNWLDELTPTELTDHALPVGLAGAILGWLDEIEPMRRVCARLAAALAADGTRSPAMTAVWAMRAIDSERAGDWARAEQELIAAEQAANDSDFVAPHPIQLLRLAYHLATRGEYERSAALRARARGQGAEQQGWPRHLAACVEGMEHLSAARFEQAVDVLAQGARIEREIGLVVSGYTSRFVDWFEAMWALGRAASAQDELAEFEAAAQVTGHPTDRATAARCRALLADADAIDEAFGRALALCERSPNRFEQARTRLRWGQRLRRARRKRAAGVQLAAALELFESMGAAPWSALARSELAACGHRRLDVAQASDRRLASLTPREFEIARAVASGLSNAAAAAQLVISRRTVEYHLASVYRKLAIVDRHELAAAFGER